MTVAQITINKLETQFEIKEEQLDIAKRLIKTGDVKIYKDSYTKEKTFTVSVQYEELVIEKKNFSSTDLDQQEIPREVIRILLSEEQVEFSKHLVTLEDVSIYKQQVEDVKHIEETLKREEAIVKTLGSAKVSYKSNL